MSTYEDGYLDGLREAARIAEAEYDAFRDELRREGAWEGDREPDAEQAHDLDQCMWGASTVYWAIKRKIADEEDGRA